MSFHKLDKWVQSRFNGYLEKSTELQSQIGVLPQWQHRYLTESLMSEIWLTWCLFSRSLVHKSLRGTKTKDNQFVTARSGNNTWQAIGYQSSRASKSENHLSNVPSNFLMRREPTWGDISCLIKIVTALSPANKTNLLTAFGLPLQGPKHLQLVRNCAAHKTIENLLNLRTELSLIYSLNPKATPSDIAWSLRTGTTELAINTWIDDMKNMADVATSSM